MWSRVIAQFFTRCFVISVLILIYLTTREILHYISRLFLNQFNIYLTKSHSASSWGHIPVRRGCECFLAVDDDHETDRTTSDRARLPVFRKKQSRFHGFRLCLFVE